MTYGMFIFKGFEIVSNFQKWSNFDHFSNLPWKRRKVSFLVYNFVTWFKSVLLLDNKNATLSYPSNNFVGLLKDFDSIIQKLWSKIALELLGHHWLGGRSVFVSVN